MHLGETGADDHEGDGQSQTLGTGVEVDFHFAEDPAQQRTQAQGGHDFNDGVEQDGDHVDFTADEGLCDAVGNGEDDQTHCIVQSDDGQQNVGEGTLCLILVDDHHGSGRSRCGGDGTQDDAGGNGQLIAQDQVQAQQHCIYQQAGSQGLEHGDDSGLTADMLQGGQAEFVTDGECDEAQGHIGNETHFFHEFKGVEAQAGNTQLAQNQGTNQNARNEVTGDVRQVEFHKQTRQKQA